jgi:aldehyde:ferredoxin oxidoreductase
LEPFQADVRSIKAYGLGNAVSSRGADHLRSEPWFEFSNDPEEGIRRYGIPETAFRLEYKGKGLVVKHFEEMAAISDATGVCKNTYNNMEVLDWEGTAALLEAATGWDLSGEDVRQVGERIVNLERLFIAREGITRRDDTLPTRFLQEPLPQGSGPSTGSVLELEPMLDEYCRARGWDVESGLPTEQKLVELGLVEAGQQRHLSRSRRQRGSTHRTGWAWTGECQGRVTPARIKCTGQEFAFGPGVGYNGTRIEP